MAREQIRAIAKTTTPIQILSILPEARYMTNANPSPMTRMMRKTNPEKELLLPISITSKISILKSINESRLHYRSNLDPISSDPRKPDVMTCAEDKQTNNQNNKQLDLLLKYWSIQKNTVVTRYYKSVLLGHAPAPVIRDCILESFKTDGIELKRLLMIGRDNPNVNKSLERLIDEEMKKVGGELLKIGPCHIHVVHNAFKAGQKQKNVILHITDSFFAFRHNCITLAHSKHLHWDMVMVSSISSKERRFSQNH